MVEWWLKTLRALAYAGSCRHLPLGGGRQNRQAVYTKRTCADCALGGTALAGHPCPDNRARDQPDPAAALFR